MKARLWYFSFFAGLLLCFAIAEGSAFSQVVLPATGYITTVAGNGTRGYVDDVQAISAEIAINATQNYPDGVDVDMFGNIYIADQGNQRIRVVNTQSKTITVFGVSIPPGDIQTVAGTGTAGYSGDGGQATSAELNGPTSVAVDAAGNLYIADASNARIRMVTASTGVITTVAGTGTAGYSGDGGQATSAKLSNPSYVALFEFGIIYIADQNNQRIRAVDPATGVITTVAGTGTAGYSGDGGLATSAEINGPTGLTVDPYGNLFFADAGNARIREVTASTGIITTVAGNGTADYAGDDGPATSAEINSPIGVVMDTHGNLVFSDAGNARIREVAASTGIITTAAGNGTAGYAGDGGLATGAELKPGGLAVDASGNLYIADGSNERIRVIGGPDAVALATANLVVNSDCTENINGCPTNVTSSAATFSGKFGCAYSFTTGCGSPYLYPQYTWYGIENPTNASCTPPSVPPGGTFTCTIPVIVGSNTSGERYSIVYMTSPGAQPYVTVSQLGPTETLLVYVGVGGSVKSSPHGINSGGGSAAAGFQYGTQVTLTATPNTGYTFSNWSGNCSGTSTTFTLVMNSPASCTATFVSVNPTFTVTLTNPSQTPPLSLGHSMTYTVNESSLNGFSGSVALSGVNLPQGVTASFSPTSITTSGNATLTLTSSYSNPTTDIGSFYAYVIGTSGSLQEGTEFVLTTETLQYKGSCGVQ